MGSHLAELRLDKGCELFGVVRRANVRLDVSTRRNHVERDDSCQICGHSRFVHDDVLWPDLIQAWQLNPAEAAYIDVQQGTRCERCGANVRSQALARALVQVSGVSGTLESCLESVGVRDLRVSRSTRRVR